LGIDEWKIKIMLKPLKIKDAGDKIFFTGCNHFRHTPNWNTPSLFQTRGFETIQDHDNWLLGEYQKLPLDATVFILGDFCLNTDENDARNLFNQILCKKYYVEGNHESQVSKYYRKLVIEQFGRDDVDVYPITDQINKLTFLPPQADVIINGQFITFNHFPLAVWNHSHKSAWNLHSHNHGTFKESLPDFPDFKRLDVGIDVFKRLVSFSEVQKIMTNKLFKVQDHHDKNTN